MPDEDENYEKYNHAEAIRQQIQQVNTLIADFKADDEQSFNEYFSRCFMALASLEAMISPFGYDSKLDGQNPLKMRRKDQLALIRNTLEEVMQFLHEENLFYAQRQGRTNVG